MSATLVDAISTNVDAHTPVTQHDKDRSATGEKWQKVIDETLLEWLLDPGQLEDEGVEAPSHETIRTAIRLAWELKEQGRAAPDSVVPDPNGGIVFERREKTLAEILHIWDDASIEYCRFDQNHLMERRYL